MAVIERKQAANVRRASCALADSSLTLLKPPCVGCQLNFAGWIKRTESTKKRKVSRLKLAAGKHKERSTSSMVIKNE